MTDKDYDLDLLAQMAASLVHEINNPVANIQSRLEIIRLRLERKRLDEDQLLEEIGTIHNSLNHISSIITTVQNISTPGDESEFEALNKNDILKGISDDLIARIKKQEIEFEIIGDEDAYFYANFNEVIQVLDNLIRNSLDALSNKGELKINVQTENENILIDVIDSGDGVSAEVVKNLFVPFKTTKPRGKGTGLGLCISKKIMHRNNGELEYIKNKEHTIFRMTLQRAYFE